MLKNHPPHRYAGAWNETQGKGKGVREQSRSDQTRSNQGVQMHTVVTLTDCPMDLILIMITIP